MPDPTVVLDPWWLKLLTATVGPLLGALVGGLIAFKTNARNEERQWERKILELRQRQDDDARNRIQAKRREALEWALGWFEHVSPAVSRATHLASGYLMSSRSEEEFRAGFPQLFPPGYPIDPPIGLRAFLPDNLYPTFLTLVREWDTFLARVIIGKDSSVNEALVIPNDEVGRRAIDRLTDLERTLHSWVRSEYLKAHE